MFPHTTAFPYGIRATRSDRGLMVRAAAFGTEPTIDERRSGSGHNSGREDLEDFAMAMSAGGGSAPWLSFPARSHTAPSVHPVRIGRTASSACGRGFSWVFLDAQQRSGCWRRGPRPFGGHRGASPSTEGSTIMATFLGRPGPPVPHRCRALGHPLRGTGRRFSSHNHELQESSGRRGTAWGRGSSSRGTTRKGADSSFERTAARGQVSRSALCCVVRTRVRLRADFLDRARGFSSAGIQRARPRRNSARKFQPGLAGVPGRPFGYTPPPAGLRGVRLLLGHGAAPSAVAELFPT